MMPLALTIEMPLLVASSSWNAFESLAVQMAKDLEAWADRVYAALY